MLSPFSAIEFGDDEKEPTYATILLIAFLSTCYVLSGNRDLLEQ